MDIQDTFFLVLLDHGKARPSGSLGLLHQMGPHRDPRTLAAPPLIFSHTGIEPAAPGRALHSALARRVPAARLPSSACYQRHLWLAGSRIYKIALTSTKQARPCLASEIRPYRARSGWYGRRHEIQRLFCIGAAAAGGARAEPGQGGARPVHSQSGAGRHLGACPWRSGASSRPKWGGATYGACLGRSGVAR